MSKLKLVESEPAPDPLREALREAICGKLEAERRVAANAAAIERLTIQIMAANAAVDVAEAAISEAQKAAVGYAADPTTPAPEFTPREAREALADAIEARDSAREARDATEQARADLRSSVEVHELNVSAAVSAIIRAQEHSIKKLIDAYSQHRREAMNIGQVLEFIENVKGLPDDLKYWRSHGYGGALEGVTAWHHAVEQLACDANAPLPEVL
jgi:hypothetical protein